MHTTPQIPTAVEGLTVGEVTSHRFVSCLPYQELTSVAAALVSYGVHAAVVAPLDRGAPLILTDTDLVRAALARDGTVPLNEITHDPAASLSSAAPLSDAVAMMAERYTRHLLVVDPVTEEAVGFMSALDVAAVLGGLPPHPDTRVPATKPHQTHEVTAALDAVSVASIACRGILTCPADASLSTVARTMAEQHVHCVAIAGVNHPGEHLIWGLVEDIDLVVAAHGGELSQPVVAFAERSPVAVQSDDSLKHAAELMISHGTSHLVVVGPAGVPAGIVSTMDVLAVLAGLVSGPR